VVLLEEDEYKKIELSSNEMRIETTRGTGKGGQHKNTTDSCVIITHIATGIKVVRDGRDQHKNKRDAIEELTKRVNNYYRIGHEQIGNSERREQIGNSDRSDKRRTYRVKDSLVVDHITNKTASLKDVLRGKINLLS
jgi:peptide chain release factor 1